MVAYNDSMMMRTLQQKNLGGPDVALSAAAADRLQFVSRRLCIRRSVP